MTDKELQPDTAADEASEAPASHWPAPGQKLKKLREEMGLSHGRVADALHMTSHYVKALEEDQYDKLPGKIFVKGYFRAYAKLLGTNVDDIMTCYEKYVAALEETVETEANVIRAKKAYDQNMRWMICAAVIIVVVVGVSWWLAGRQDTDAVMADSSTSNNVAEISASGNDAVTAEVLIATLGENEQQTGIRAGKVADDLAMPDPEMNAPAEDLAETVADAAEAVVEETVTAQGSETGNPVATMPAAGDEAVISASAKPGDLIETTDTVAAIEQEAPGDAENPGDSPVYTVTEQDNHRLVQLESEGDDLLQIHFTGASWIEVDNSENTRLYNDMLGTGDDLTIRGQAPFNILIGDANVVELTFNSEQVDVTPRIRTDNSARLILEPETR